MTDSTAIQPLAITFARQTMKIRDSLTFGRQADLSLDESNKFMHRITGMFEPRGSDWWLYNIGATARLRVFGSDGSKLDLPPKTNACLTATTGTISFTAGAKPYEITYDLAQSRDVPLVQTPGGMETSKYGASLTSRQIDYLIEFARPTLNDSGKPSPSYKEVARRCGVSRKTVDNSLQEIRRRLNDSGVANIETLEQLIAHLLATGKLTYSHMLERDSELD